MRLGKIDSSQSYLTHKIGGKLLELLKEHPDYPIAVLAGESANSGDYSWMYCTSVGVGIEEILDCNTDYWTSDYICTDRDDFEDTACDKIWDDLRDELVRKPTDEELESEWQKVKESHEPYWKKCICIYADN